MNDQTKIEKQFTIKFMGAMAVFLMLLVVQTFSIELLDLNTWQKVFVTLLPTTPLFWAFFIFRKRFLLMDEFLQRLTGEAFLWSMGIVGFLAFGYGMLAMQFEIPDISLSFILPAFFGGHALVYQLLLIGKQ